MSKHFDKEKWQRVTARPDWYLEFTKERQEIESRRNKMSKEEWEMVRQDFFSFFEEKYLEGELALGTNGPDWDKDRKEIDTVVIHHTSGAPGMSWQTISVIHLLNVYASYYANPDPSERHIKGQGIYSGHFREGEQVFYSYHWVVRSDGEVERLLNDDEIGWHAGNWDINTRSAAVVLDGDFTEDTPPEPMLEATARLIRDKYPRVSKERMFGHREVKKKGITSCPGNLFLAGSYGSGWKADLLARI